jgi:hypothetical protein
MKIPDVVSSLLRTSAPTLLTALLLPPPFSLLASAAVTTVLNKYLPEDQTPAQPASRPGGTPTLAPEQVTQIIQKNAGRPELLADLQKAELQLEQFEQANNLKFAELAVRDKTRASDFQLASGLSRPLLVAGLVIVGVAMLAMVLLVIGSILIVRGDVTVPAGNAQLAVGVFGLIGAVVGYISGYASQIVGFYYGSSQGSQDKAQALTNVLQNQGAQIAQAAGIVSTAANQATAQTERVLNTVSSVIKEGSPAGRFYVAAPAAAPTALDPADLRRGPFGGIRWWLTREGIILENDKSPERTVGEPVTVRRIWSNYSKFIEAACAKYGVPIELVVTVIAVESRGQIDADRVEVDSRESVGLMQTLIGTAKDMLQPTLTAADLIKPEISINAGTAYFST